VFDSGGCVRNEAGSIQHGVQVTVFICSYCSLQPSANSVHTMKCVRSVRQCTCVVGFGQILLIVCAVGVVVVGASSCVRMAPALACYVWLVYISMFHAATVEAHCAPLVSVVMKDRRRLCKKNRHC
jgi:hypothetical protein